MSQPVEGFNHHCDVDSTGQPTEQLAEQLEESLSLENGDGNNQDNGVNQAAEDVAINQESTHDPLHEEGPMLLEGNLDTSIESIKRLILGQKRESRNQSTTGNDHEIQISVSAESGNNPVSNQEPRLQLYGHISMDNGRNSEYSMNHLKRGKCLIFNHEKFDDPQAKPDRKGTQKDAFELNDCFTSLGFNVIQLDNFTKDDLMRKCDEVSKEDHSNADCFVCCILTHGDGDDSILNARDVHYNKKDVFEFFTADNCKSLAGKPKLFFIQACRAARTDAHSLVALSLHDVDSGCEADGGPPSEEGYIPIWADFLISYSTLEGQVSWRNTEYGSLFVQHLASLLKRWGREQDLVDILTLVAQRVSESSMNLTTDPNCNQNCRQVPQTIHLLTKKLIFRPKMNIAIQEAADITRT